MICVDCHVFHQGGKSKNCHQINICKGQQQICLPEDLQGLPKNVGPFQRPIYGLPGRPFLKDWLDPAGTYCAIYRGPKIFFILMDEPGTLFCGTMYLTDSQNIN